MEDVLHISTLFNEERVMKPKGKIESERASLIRFFVKKTNQVPKVLAIKVSHYNLDQLYALQSGFKDRESHQDLVTACKWFNWMIRTHTLSPDVKIA